MSECIVTQIVRGPVIFKTYTWGNIEIRQSKYDLPSESKALANSMMSFGLTEEILREGGQNSEAELSRISTIVNTKEGRQPLAIARERFAEALDVLDIVTMLRKYALLEPGYIRHLDTGRMEPLHPLHSRLPRYFQNPILQIDITRFSPMDLGQIVLAKQAPGRADIDLADRLLRSAYWSRRARTEDNPQLRVLFRWFAIEAIWMIEPSQNGSISNNDVITPIMWAFGFPRGQGSNLVTRKASRLRREVENHDVWKMACSTRLAAIREFRNRSVHNGFRHYDISPRELLDFDIMTYHACAAVQRQVELGLVYGFQTAAELLEYLPLLFEASCDSNHVRKLIEGLQHPENFIRYVQSDWDLSLAQKE